MLCYPKQLSWFLNRFPAKLLSHTTPEFFFSRKENLRDFLEVGWTCCKWSMWSFLSKCPIQKASLFCCFLQQYSTNISVDSIRKRRPFEVSVWVVFLEIGSVLELLLNRHSSQLGMDFSTPRVVQNCLKIQTLFTRVQKASSLQDFLVNILVVQSKASGQKKAIKKGLALRWFLAAAHLRLYNFPSFVTKNKIVVPRIFFWTQWQKRKLPQSLAQVLFCFHCKDDAFSSLAFKQTLALVNSLGKSLFQIQNIIMLHHENIQIVFLNVFESILKKVLSFLFRNFFLNFKAQLG